MHAIIKFPLRIGAYSSDIQRARMLDHAVRFINQTHGRRKCGVCRRRCGSGRASQHIVDGLSYAPKYEKLTKKTDKVNRFVRCVDVNPTQDTVEHCALALDQESKNRNDQTKLPKTGPTAELALRYPSRNSYAYLKAAGLWTFDPVNPNEWTRP